MIRVKELVSLLSKLRGSVVRESATMLEILQATGLARARTKNADVEADDVSAMGSQTSALWASTKAATVVIEESKTQQQQPSGPGEEWDSSVLSKLMDYEDFTTAICRTIISDVWILTPPAAPALGSQRPALSTASMLESSSKSPKSPPRSPKEGGDEDDVQLSVKQRLGNGLTAWLHIYESKPLPI